jgi:hypothetical protein
VIGFALVDIASGSLSTVSQVSVGATKISAGPIAPAGSRWVPPIAVAPDTVDAIFAVKSDNAASFLDWTTASEPNA